MKIKVTREDIEKGERRDPHSCPVGRAVSRAGIIHCCVTESAVIVPDGGPSPTALLLPDVVQSWILDFDAQKPVQPISFEVGLPVPVVCNCSGHEQPNGCAARARRAGVELASNGARGRAV